MIYISFILIVAMCLGFVSYRENSFSIERKLREESHSKERQKLLDRIQARDFVEFKQHEEPIKPKEVDPEKDLDRYIEL